MRPMQRILVLGAGKIGSLIAGLLADTGQFDVLIADNDPAAAEAAATGHWPRAVRHDALDAMDSDAVARYLQQRGCQAVICCLPYFANPPVARAARTAGVHYFDLTEDVDSTRAVREASDGAVHAFVPQCGLAPGMISIIAAGLMERFETVDTVRLRVGALPARPHNALKYALNWSTDGLVNEYGNPCLALEDGREVTLPPLHGLESLVIDGVQYEAFNTSGGLGTLAESCAGKVRSMDYKTLRYPGHAEVMRLLMQDLRLNEDRATLKRILERALPGTDQDVVVLYVAVAGTRDGRFVEDMFVRHIYPHVVDERLWTAIQVATAAGACAAIDLVLAEPAAYKGFVRQESFNLDAVLGNRFGRVYAADGDRDAAMQFMLEKRT